MKIKSFNATEEIYMKVLKVYAQKPRVEIINDRNVKIIEKCYIDVITDEGVLSYTILPGFITNGRSGPGFIDGFVPHFGNSEIFVSWLIHDINYYEFLSKDLADDVLKQMLILAHMSWVKANIVKKSVQWLGDNAYGLDSFEDKKMKQYIHFNWHMKVKESKGDTL